METKANYALIGAFALAGLLGVLGFFTAFGTLQLSRETAIYEARFDTVSGLSRAAEVRFAGLTVGRVQDVMLSPDGDGTALVILEVERSTPVRADSVARLDSSGITGVSFVAILPGTPDAPLVNDSAQPVALRSGRSTMQSLSEGAPQVLEETLRVLEQVNRLLGDENQARVSAILENVERSSGEVTRALDNFAGFTDTIAAATDTFTEFSENLAPILLQAEKTIESLQFAIDEAALVATQAHIAFEAGTKAIENVDDFVTSDLRDLVADLRQTSDAVQEELAALSRDAQTLFAEFTRTGAAATQRLEALDPAIAQLEPVLSRSQTTLAALEQMSISVEALVSGDGAALVAEAREMVQSVRDTTRVIADVTEQDLPVIVADIRAATSDIRSVVAQVGADLSAASGRIDALSDAGLQTLDQVTETFANANTTLGAINRALSVGERTLEAAERTFAGADRVINEEIALITADLRDVLGRLGRAVDSVADDIPSVTADLRRTADSAAKAFDDLGRIIRDSAGPVREFTSAGLPNITQLARETRGLISNLDSLTRQLERDPTRFLLNRQTPEFRR